MTLRELTETIENRQYTDWSNAEHPLEFVRSAVMGAIMMADPNARREYFECPVVYSIVTCIAATALRDAGDSLGNAFADAIHRAGVVAKMLAGDDAAEAIRDCVFEWYGIEVC